MALFEQTPVDVSGSASDLYKTAPSGGPGFNGYMGASVLASGLASAGSAYAQYTALESQAAYQRQVAEFNSKLADIQYENILEQGNKAANNQAKKVKKVIGSQRASFAAQGIDLSSGVVQDITSDTKEMGDLDVLTIRNNVWLAAWGEKVAGTNANYSAGFAEAASRNRANASLLTGGQEFLNSGLRAGAYFSKK